MAGPWEKYAPASDGPWSKYAAPTTTAPAAAVPQRESQGSGGSSAVGNFGAGLLRGAKDVVDTGAHLLASGFDKIAGTDEGARVQAMNDAGKAEFKQGYGGSTAASLGRVGGQVAATLPVGGALGAAVKMGGAVAAAPRLAALGDAIATGGLKGGNLLTRAAGGAVAGGATGALVDPDAAGAGAAIGAAMPGAFAVLGRGVQAGAGLVAPFFKSGQEAIVGRALNAAAHDANGARRALASAAEMVPGSAPTTAAASGGIGLAGLQRAMANQPGFANELAARASAQNQARTSALEALAGNPGKIAVAKAERDRATSAMRDAALQRAGQVDAQGLLASLDGMLARPENAGLYTKAAINQLRGQLASNAADGAIPAEALYAIRKDVGHMMDGRLKGDAGNMSFARKQLVEARGLMDDAMQAAIDKRGGDALAKLGQSAETPSWRGYLQKYADMSKPIDQMSTLSDVLRSVQTGATDTMGNLVLSPAKMNNLLKNQGADLAAKLTPAQMQVVRNIAGDLNAAALANTAGKAPIGSNTVQNLASGNFVDSLLGKRIGGSELVNSTIGRAAKWATKSADESIAERLGNALLDPAAASRLMQKAADRQTAVDRLRDSRALSGLARALPVLPGQD